MALGTPKWPRGPEKWTRGPRNQHQDPPNGLWHPQNGLGPPKMAWRTPKIGLGGPQESPTAPKPTPHPRIPERMMEPQKYPCASYRINPRLSHVSMELSPPPRCPQCPHRVVTVTPTLRSPWGFLHHLDPNISTGLSPQPQCPHHPDVPNIPVGFSPPL